LLTLFINMKRVDSRNRDESAHILWTRHRIITMFLTLLFVLVAYISSRKNGFEWNMVGILLVLFLMLLFFIITLRYGWLTVKIGSYVWKKGSFQKVFNGISAKIIGLILILISLIFIGLLIYAMIQLYFLT